MSLPATLVTIVELARFKLHETAAENDPLDGPFAHFDGQLLALCHAITH